MYMYIYTCIYMLIYKCIYIYKYEHTCICIMYTYNTHDITQQVHGTCARREKATHEYYTCANTHTHTHMCVCVCLCVCVCIYA